MKTKKGSVLDKINQRCDGYLSDDALEYLDKVLSSKNAQIKNLKKKIRFNLYDINIVLEEKQKLENRLTLSKIAAQRAMTEKQFQNYLKLLGMISFDDNGFATQQGTPLSPAGIMFFKLGLQARDMGKWFAITKLGCEDNHFDQKTATEILNYFKTLPEYQLVMENRTGKTLEEARSSEENKEFVGEQSE